MKTRNIDSNLYGENQLLFVRHERVKSKNKKENIKKKGLNPPRERERENPNPLFASSPTDCENQWRTTKR